MQLPLRVILIEDDENDVVLVLRELKRGGYETEHLVVQTAEELQSALAADKWDMILSDYSLPLFSAPAALKQLKKSGRSIPFIVISGAVGEEIAVQLIQHGAADYINKDRLTRLCPVIQRELDNTRSKAEVQHSKEITDRLWDMVNNSQSEFYIFDASELTFIFVNQGALNNLGYTFDEIRTKHQFDILPEFSKDQFLLKVKPLLDGVRSSLQFETIHERKNGSTYPVEFRLQLNRTPQGNFFFAVVLDITNKVNANNTIESLAKFPEENPSPVLRLSNKGEILYFNPACHQIVSLWTNIYHQNVPEHWQTLLKECLEEEKVVEFEETIDNTQYQWMLSASQSKAYINCYGRDVTQQRLAENDQRQAAMVFESSIEGIVICDQDNNILRVNPAFSKITGYSAEEVQGKSPDILRSEKHSSRFFDKMWHDLHTKGNWQGEIWNKRKNGEIFPDYMTISVLKNPDGSIKNYIAVFTDISERVAAEKRIHHMAYYDALTDLPNRFYIHEIISQLLSEAKRSGLKLALIYIDLKRFKALNESLGHNVADNTLKHLAQRLVENQLPDSRIAHMGGDEFLVAKLCNELIDENSEIIIEMFKSIQTPIRLPEIEVYMDATIGVAHYPDDGDDVEILLKNAESALNHAKITKSSITVFSREVNVKSVEHFSFESQLRQALEKQEFVLHYQPQVELNTGKVVGVEALLRWEHPEKGLIPPIEFIPLLEETGLILAVGKWLIRRVCQQILAWEKLGLSIRVSINLSARQFVQKDLSSEIQAILQEYQVEPELIEIEVTESTIMNRNSHVLETMDELHKCKINISIDDFGTGYSSLSYLKHFPIDILKIDRSFVMELPHNSDDIAIVNTIISMGHNLKLIIIAEGVETQKQAELLKQLGCEYAQGYYFSRPLPPDDCAKYILSTNVRRQTG